MNRYLKMIVFVSILGLFTSALLLGMNQLTNARIAANEEAKLKSMVLDGFDIPYTDTTINQVFDDTVTVEVIDGYTYYIDDATNALTFRFEGGGVWGPIIGLLTLDSDLETIVYITILEQEETPGLGGVVAERPYLSTFEGKLMTIDIKKEALDTSDSEVDAITGATRTSDAFETILNSTYETVIPIWENNQE
ncbi:MAG: FMN-binding protein [Candidatus Izimaplasma sp.]|nr:FMN-binding protein [Candidatus Izimaplasma bacterium]